jgi:hypothetical protein
MRPNRGFDEVMIVNPYDPRSDREQGVKLMPYFSQAPGFGYYGEDPYGYYSEPPEMAGWGEVEPGYGEAEPVGYFANEPYGYYAEPPEMGYYGEEPYGYYGEEPYGYYGEDPYGYYGEEPYGYAYGYAEPPEMGYYGEDPYGEAEPYGYYAEPPEMGYYGEPEPYGEMPEMVGYGYGEDPYAHYGEPEFSGYVRDVPSQYNAGCPLPTNVAGFGETPPLEGYIRPAEVSPNCERFTPQPGPTPSVPETFRPLW